MAMLKFTGARVTYDLDVQLDFDDWLAVFEEMDLEHFDTLEIDQRRQYIVRLLTNVMSYPSRTTEFLGEPDGDGVVSVFHVDFDFNTIEIDEDDWEGIFEALDYIQQQQEWDEFCEEDDDDAEE